MGLDMYLTRKVYVKNWNHTRPDKRHEVTVLKNGVPLSDIKPERITYVIEEVAYWRKANQIHQWFVTNIQGGEDDCGKYLVSIEKLRELVGLCKQVLDSVETVDGVI